MTCMLVLLTGLLVSCGGVPVTVRVPEPGPVALAWDCPFAVRCEGNHMRAMGAALREVMIASGFSRQVTPSKSQGALLLTADIEPDISRSRRAYSDLAFRVQLTAMYGNTRVLSRHYTRMVTADARGYRDYAPVCREIAADFVNRLMPQMKPATVRVRCSADNPAMEQAAQACTEGRYYAAGKLARQAVETQPENAEAWYLYALIARQSGDYTAAAEYLATAVRLSPEARYQRELEENPRMQQDYQRAHSQLMQLYPLTY